MASTRKRMSVVRPEATAAPSRPVRMRSLQVSPMVLAGLALGRVGSSGHPPLAADAAALESHCDLPGAQTVPLGQSRSHRSGLPRVHGRQRGPVC